MNKGKTLKCKECEFRKMYDYGKKIYYCDNVDRVDDMGKLSADNLQKTSPEWCPLKCKKDNFQDEDLIHMESDINLTDKYGNPIEVKVPRSEYMPEVFFTENRR